MLFLTLKVVKRKHLLSLCAFLFSLQSFAQISLSFPTNRIVFQRNNNNIGFINILGNYSQPVDKIEARLIPVTEGQGVALDWTTIQDHPQAGYFSGRLTGFGGWYIMEVRALKDNNILQTITIDRVGIGEVFVALGQSNASGLPLSELPGNNVLRATDDRVNTINFSNRAVLDPLPENLNFVHLEADVDIAPAGNTAWCYGELGDRLAKKLNVPIMFFNAGELSVSVINWRESAQGIPTTNIFGQVMPKGLPYTNLRNTLHYYGALLGMRSLLWLQGETDNYPKQLSATDYASNLQTLIDITRAQFSGDLSWVVARTSLTYLNPSNPQIIAGQNMVIDRPGNNVFPGPYTDDLQIPRPDHVHFKNVPGNYGLSILAENWDIYLDDNFFRNSTPVLPRYIVDVNVGCDPNNQATLTLPDYLASYWWSNGESGNQITVDKGVYSVKVRDHQGNQLLVPTINTNFIYPVEKPQITYQGDLEFCVNKQSSISLTATGTEFNNFRWNIGADSPQIVANSSGHFLVRGYNQFGCASALSDTIAVQIHPAPIKPQIAVSPSSSVCEGTNIRLSVDNDEALLWNNNLSAKTFSIDSLGVYNFSVTATNSFGCSEKSDSVEVRINPLPAKPHIMVSPDTIVCKGVSIKLSADTNESILWSNNNTTNEISIDSAGDYTFSVKSITSFGCARESDTQKISIKQTPASPDIDRVGIYTLRALNVNLGDSEQFQWIKGNNKFSTSKVPSLKVQEDGNYQVSVLRTYQLDGNRTITCESTPSKSFALSLKSVADEVTLYPNPAYDFLYLETKANLKNIQLSFYHYSGKLVYVHNLADTTERKGIDLRKMENGSYIVKIKHAEFEKTDRIIITQK